MNLCTFLSRSLQKNRERKLRWPNTVFARTFVYAIQRAHKDFKKQTCRQKSDHFSYSTPALSVLFFSINNDWTQSIDGFSILLQRYARKVTMERTQQFSAFVRYRKNPVKCSSCAVAQKIETDCFCRNLRISNDPVVRISRNLAKKEFRNHVNDLNFDIGNF